MMSAKYNELAKKIRRVYRGRKQKSVNDKIANVWQGLFGNYEKRADFNNQRYNKIMKEYDQEIRRLNNNKKDGNILNMFKTLNKGVKAEMDDDTIASDKIAEDDSATDDDEEQQSEEQHSAHYLINFIDFIAIFLDTKSCVALSICCTQTQIIMQEVLDDFLEILDFTIYDDTVRAGNANDDGIDDVKSYVKPKTLQQLKEYIKKEFDDCIHFFERRRGGKEHYYCKFCIEHPECTKAPKFIRNNEKVVSVFRINLYEMQIICINCRRGSTCVEELATMGETHEYTRTCWIDGRPLKDLRPGQLIKHRECNAHDELDKAMARHYLLWKNGANFDGNDECKEEENPIEMEFDDDCDPLDNRFKIHLFMMREKLPSHRFKAIMSLQSSLKTPKLGYSGTSSTVVRKQTALCGAYIHAIYVSYAVKNVRAMALGLDAVKTRDDHKIIHINLRIVCGAYPLTFHFASRKVLGSCTGAALLTILKRCVTGADIEDVDYIGMTFGNTYYEIESDKERVDFINILSTLKESGLPMAFEWETFIQLLMHYCSDGGGDVWGKNIGLRGRLCSIKREVCGVDLTTTHGVCHQIDLFANDSFLSTELFDEIFDMVKDGRAFQNRSEATKSLHTECVLMQCPKYLTVPRDFETRWLINKYQAVNAWTNNIKGTNYLLQYEKNREKILAKCKKDDDKQRVEGKMDVLCDKIVKLRSAMMSYGSQDILRCAALKYQVLAETGCLNVIQYINQINELEMRMRTKLGSIDRQNRMYSFMVRFHDENIINHRVNVMRGGRRKMEMRFRWEKYDIVENDKDSERQCVFEEFTTLEYYRIVREVQAMYVDALNAILAAIAEHKEEDQFNDWYLFKKIADYTSFQLTDIRTSTEYIQSASKSSIHDLYDSKYNTFLTMGMDEMTKSEFTERIVESQTLYLSVIDSFRVSGQERLTLEQIVQQKHIEFYDVSELVLAKQERTHPFQYVYEYFISIQPGNVMSERQGRIMNLIRPTIAQNMGVQLMDNKIRGHFNVPNDISMDMDYTQHIKVISWLWRNVIRGHDVSQPTNLKHELDLSMKLPKIKSKCYAKVKRAMKRNNSVGNVWKSIVFNVNRFRKRKFKNRGKSKKK
eukprot:796761_1